MARSIGQQLQHAERVRQAIEFRKAGMTWPQIATEVGYASAQTASHAVKSYLDDLPQEAAVDLRRINIERLNYILTKCWPGVMAGDIDMMREARATIAHLDRLMGTEAPQQLEVNENTSNTVVVIGVSRDEYIEGLKRMAGIQDDLPPAPKTNGTNGSGNGKPKAIEAQARDEEASGPCNRYTRPRGKEPGAPCKCGYPKEDH